MAADGNITKDIIYEAVAPDDFDVLRHPPQQHQRREVGAIGHPIDGVRSARQIPDRAADRAQRPSTP